VGRYLVTGCAGFIGSHLTEALLARGHEVVGVDAFRAFYPRATKERSLSRAAADARFSLLELDLAEAPPPLDGIDAVVHLAAQPGVRSSWGASFGAFVRDNVLATQRLVEAAAQARIRVVLASTSAVYGNAPVYPVHEEIRPGPVSPYGVTKLACEHLARAYARSHGLDAVSLRYFTVYGPRQRPDMAFARMIAAVNQSRIFRMYGDGTQSRDFTYVADAVEATIAALERAPSGRVYNVGGGAEARLLDAVRVCEQLTGRALHVIYDAPAAGDVRRTAADTSLIRGELGWKPRTTLADGLAAQLADVDDPVAVAGRVA
jgi:nucleoside-diphosphate-sugar epimerase